MTPLLPGWAPNVHPLVVHFPIALWIAAVVVDLVGLMRPRTAWAIASASFLYPAAAISAGVAYLTGRRAAATVLLPGMADPIVLQHWNWALVTTSAFVLITLARLYVRFKRPPTPFWMRTLVTAAALLALVALFETGTRGGRLVFEQGVGVAAPAGYR